MAKPTDANVGAFGFFGKLPRRGDFIRRPQGCALDLAWERWLTHVVQEGDLFHPPGPEGDVGRVGFVFSTPQHRELLVGVLIPSHDAFGRRFPFSIYRMLPRQRLEGQFALGIPQLLRQLSADEVWSHRRVAEESGEIPDGLLGAPTLPLEELSQSQQEAARSFQSLRCDAFHARLFDSGADGIHHGYATFRQAMARALDGNAAGGLLCPLGAPGDEWLWLELTRRMLPGERLPTMLWRRQLPGIEVARDGFLLLWGAPSSRAGVWWTEVGQDDAAIWRIVPYRPPRAAGGVVRKSAEHGPPPLPTRFQGDGGMHLGEFVQRFDRTGLDVTVRNKFL